MLKPLNDSLKPQCVFIKYCSIGFYHLSFGFLKRGGEFVISFCILKSAYKIMKFTERLQSHIQQPKTHHFCHGQYPVLS